MKNSNELGNETNNMNSRQQNILEYINLSNIDYEYIIEELIFDPNKFVFKQELSTGKESQKTNKKDKKEKETKGKQNKKKNKKIKEEEDLNLSKASSKMSIFSTKPQVKKDNNPQLSGQKSKVGTNNKGKALNVNLMVEKNRVKGEVQTRKQSDNKSNTNELSNQPIEELVDTTQI